MRALCQSVKNDAQQEQLPPGGFGQCKQDVSMDGVDQGKGEQAQKGQRVAQSGKGECWKVGLQTYLNKHPGSRP